MKERLRRTDYAHVSSDQRLMAGTEGRSDSTRIFRRWQRKQATRIRRVLRVLRCGAFWTGLAAFATVSAGDELGDKTIIQRNLRLLGILNV